MTDKPIALLLESLYPQNGQRAPSDANKAHFAAESQRYDNIYAQMWLRNYYTSSIVIYILSSFAVDNLNYIFVMRIIGC
jgi:hypothetical protein